MLVLRCEERSCLVINPHLFTEPRNTAYGTNSVMGTVVPGDTFSFYEWPQADMVPHRHPGSASVVVSTKEVTDPELLAEAATLVPVLRGGGALADGRDEFPRVRGWTAFTNHTVSWNAEELWHVEFDGRVPAGVGRAAMITIDTISNAGARIENTRKPHDHCWRLGCIPPIASNYRADRLREHDVQPRPDQVLQRRDQGLQLRERPHPQPRDHL